MNPALAGPALVAAAVVALFSFSGGAAPPAAAAGDPPGSLSPGRPADERLAGSAVAELIRANGGRLPAGGEELAAALGALADDADLRPAPPAAGDTDRRPNTPARTVAPHGFAQLPVVFSAVALDSGLTRPRLVITAPLRADPPPPDDQARPTPPPVGGWGSGGFGGPVLNPAAATAPNLDGRLFLAANLTAEFGTDPRVKSVEFISWNTRRLRFDFGVIDYDGGTPELKLVDGIRCFTCHKNRGPILGADPWSNTAHNRLLRTTAAGHLRERTATARPDGWYGGLLLLSTQAREVDAAVRRGADLGCDREMFRLMTKSEDGRKGLVVLFTAVATPGRLADVDRVVDPVFAPAFPRFAADLAALRAATPPSLLHDFSPSRLSVPARNPGLVVTQYDNRRAHGDPGLPAGYQPSNPRAFDRTPRPRPDRPSALLTPGRLARTVGLTDGDRAAMADSLGYVRALLVTSGLPDVSAGALAGEAFTGPAFADVLAGGPLPDREDFKDRFMAGLAEAARVRGAARFTFPRERYASGPNHAPKPGEEVKEVELVPTTACLRCHDVRPAGKRGTDPVPPLAFDPFDRAGREAWVRAADRGRAADVLARMLRRVGTDQDMPPEDAAEYELFRQKDPAAFDELKRFLEAELRKVK